MKLLIINTYAGSLLVGAELARKAGVPVEVVGSCEDGGFGQEVARLNFPKVNHTKETKDWPSGDLRDTAVIAHPPCAAFSLQNVTNEQVQGKTYRGTSTDAFACHRRVMDYALSKKCAALAIESVPGALAAKETYEEYAQKYGYAVYFILQNAVSFGVPQWRPRLWVVFCESSRLLIDFSPRYRVLESVADPGGEADPVVVRRLQRIYTRFAEAKFDWQKLLDDGHVGGFLSVCEKFLGVKDPSSNKHLVRKKTGTLGLFHTCLPRVLDPLDFASTVLSDSYFFMAGRPCSRKEYHRIMGFPDNYRWPAGQDSDFRKYLSKGVCPPVAAWVIRQLALNLGEVKKFTSSHVVQPGEVLDLKPVRAEAIKAARQRRLKYAE